VPSRRTCATPSIGSSGWVDVIGTRPRQKRGQNIRRLHLPRVRYYVYYSVDAAKGEIVVLSLWHASRGTGPKI